MNKQSKRGEQLKKIFLVFSLITVLMITACDTDGNIAKENDSTSAMSESDELSAKEKLAELQKQREELEKTRREEMDEFYVPLPPLGEEKKMKTVKAKALYITGNVAGFKFQEEDIEYYANYIKAISGQSGETPDSSRLEELNKLEKALGIAKSSEINSLVIDIKSDDGHVTWDSELEVVSEVGSNTNPPFKEYKTLFEYLDKNEIYKIARIVAFKDPILAKAKPEHAIQLKEGGSYIDRDGNAWVNPFDKYVWNYVIGLSKESALRGFDEIQFDYIRFPDGASYYNSITKFPGRNDRDKDEGIEDFLVFAEQELQPYDVHISADVFGVVTNSWDDSDDIGQTWRKIANKVEYICPMIYPSHYGPGYYGFNVPDRHPYEVVKQATMEAIERNAAQKAPGDIRPWFQGFTAPWIKGNIKYDAKAISDQMVAANELGIEEYIIWNAANNYDPMSFFYQDRVDKSGVKEGQDIMDRTPEEALERFLKAERNPLYSRLYLLTPIEDREEDFDEFVKEMEKTNPILKSYDIKSVTKKENGEYLGVVDVAYTSDLGEFNSKDVEYKIIKGNEVFKIKTSKIDWKKEEE